MPGLAVDSQTQVPAGPASLTIPEGGGDQRVNSGVAISPSPATQNPEALQEASKSRTERAFGGLGRGGAAISISIVTTPLGLLLGALKGLKESVDTAVKSANYACGRVSASEDASLLTRVASKAGKAGAYSTAFLTGFIGQSVLIPYYTVAGGVAGFCLGPAIAHDMGTALQDAQTARTKTWEALGKPHPQTKVSMNQQIASRDALPGQTLNTVMENLRQQLGGDDRLSSAEMQRYIFMGERVALALDNTDNEYKGGPIDISLPGSSRPSKIKPNLDTVRALSWYLQAKAVVDNQGPHRPLAMMKRGAMFAQDPNGKLFNFLHSADNTYGRGSSHIKERDLGERAGLTNVGLTGWGLGLKGAKAQFGIEDFGSKMPSDGGCLLFAQISANAEHDGKVEPELFLKWEPEGMPTVYGIAQTHADTADGWVAKVLNRFKAHFRCIDHTVNFLNSATDHSRPPPQKAEVLPLRREAAHKGQPEVIYREFVCIANKVFGDGPGFNAMKKEAKEYGLHRMETLLQGEQFTSRQDLQAEISNLLQGIDGLKNKMGSDLGIRRKGAEIHVRPFTSK